MSCDSHVMSDPVICIKESTTCHRVTSEPAMTLILQTRTNQKQATTVSFAYGPFKSSPSVLICLLSFSSPLCRYTLKIIKAIPVLSREPALSAWLRPFLSNNMYL
ncbi:hypothetical protein ATANTOWER_010394 [Ataeniobius toweri]|uniref:Uncharacterized protein n=1 Tax=Ataeniobius toweri TaxID=208326 RepID=A0ABU7C139_9TELE|nr:hypothetical protein [Ataeniobius toweri]